MDLSTICSGFEMPGFLSGHLLFSEIDIEVSLDKVDLEMRRFSMNAVLPANHRKVQITRFDILAVLAQQDRAISCREMAEMLGCFGWYSRDFRSSLTARLGKLWHWGLVKRRLNPCPRPYHARCGVFLWSISTRGRSRRQWAREQGLISPPDRDGR